MFHEGENACQHVEFGKEGGRGELLLRLRGQFLMNSGGIPRTSIPNGRALVAAWFAIYLMVVPAAMRDAYAAVLPEEQVDALLELLEKTSFDAVGLDKGYGRLVLWERADPIKIRIILNEAFMADEEIPVWVRKIITQIHQALGPTAKIRIAGTEDTLGADILIVSTDKREFFVSDVFRRYLLEDVGLSNDEIEFTLEKIEEIHHGEELGWIWPKLSKNKFDEKTLDKFIGIIHPDKTFFKSIFSKVITTALGYGNGSSIGTEMRIDGEKRIASVHTRMQSGQPSSFDEILIHFLYSSEIKTGMTKTNTRKILREWLASEYFKGIVSPK